MVSGAELIFVPITQNLDGADLIIVPWVKIWSEIKNNFTFKDRIRLIQRPLIIEFDGKDLGDPGKKIQDSNFGLRSLNHR